MTKRVVPCPTSHHIEHCQLCNNPCYRRSYFFFFMLSCFVYTRDGCRNSIWKFNESYFCPETNISSRRSICTSDKRDCLVLGLWNGRLKFLTTIIKNQTVIQYNLKNIVVLSLLYLWNRLPLVYSGIFQISMYM